MVFNADKMYKNIIPELVSLDTNFKKIRGFHICQDLNFFDQTVKKNKLHYKVILKDDIIIPKDYEFRNEYFIKKGECWYYEKKILFIHLKFEYNAREKAFYFNRAYSFFPFQIGGICPVGVNISAMISLDMFLAGIFYGRGMAVQINNKTFCFCAPGFNGKTFFLNYCLKKGAKYIAEDILVIDFIKNEVYPTCPFLKYNFWQSRKIEDALKKGVKKDIIIKNSMLIDKLYLFQNSLFLNYQPKNKNFFEFSLFSSLYFFINLFTSSYIFEEGLSNSVLEQIMNLKKINTNYVSVCIKNFNISSIFEKL